ncbi:hypothetical protein [Methanocella sp. MCL-LM]|uniref:hypothetical protein n=1 Tax=Methanocella sp. MCL-LM TaxID=3412035 RepID=UPI003C79671A
MSGITTRADALKQKKSMLAYLREHNPETLECNDLHIVKAIDSWGVEMRPKKKNRR